MKQLEKKNLRFTMMMNKLMFAFLASMFFSNLVAQETVSEDTAEEAVMVETDTKIDSTNFKRTKLDGIAAVVGDYVILDSDIEKTLIDLKSQGASTEDITHCSLLGKLME